MRRRSRRVSQVVGAYRPAYDTERKAITVPASQVRRGDRGSHVLALQVLLNGVAGAGLEVDGVAGEATEGAIRSAQRAHGLTEDGIAGKNTWGALLE